MSELKGLEAWLPRNNGTTRPTDTNTMLGQDGFYYDPNNLESYFAENSDLFWSVSRNGAFVQASSALLQQGIDNLKNAIAKDLYGTGE